MARDRGMRVGVLAAALFVAAFALVLAPWTLRNYVVLDRFVPVTTGGGKALFVATYLPGDGRQLRVKRELIRRFEGKQDVTDREVADTQMKDLLDKVARKYPDLERDAALAKIGRENFRKYVREDPVGYAGMVVTKMWNVWRRGSGPTMRAGGWIAFHYAMLGAGGPGPGRARLAAALGGARAGDPDRRDHGARRAAARGAAPQRAADAAGADARGRGRGVARDHRGRVAGGAPPRAPAAAGAAACARRRSAVRAAGIDGLEVCGVMGSKAWRALAVLVAASHARWSPRPGSAQTVTERLPDLVADPPARPHHADVRPPGRDHAPAAALRRLRPQPRRRARSRCAARSAVGTDMTLTSCSASTAATEASSTTPAATRRSSGSPMTATTTGT